MKPLNTLEVEIIDLFVQFSHTLGQPKSVAEIYGLLFVSPRPLSMEEMMERLQISKGSTSQGLRFLRSLGAVKPVYVPGQRAAHFECVAALRTLATRFLRDQILAHLDGSLDRIDRLPALTESTACQPWSGTCHPKSGNWFVRESACCKAGRRRRARFCRLC